MARRRTANWGLVAIVAVLVAVVAVVAGNRPEPAGSPDQVTLGPRSAAVDELTGPAVESPPQ